MNEAVDKNRDGFRRKLHSREMAKCQDPYQERKPREKRDTMELPLGEQGFEALRKRNCYYVDKTRYIWELTSHGDDYFLSRPRRFGKSLLVSTLECLFEGKKELFKGLYIYDKWDWSQKYPVLTIDLGGKEYTNENDLEEDIFAFLDTLEDEYS